MNTNIRNLLGGGVNLSEVVSMDFMPEDLVGGFDFGDTFSDTDSDQPILEATIRTFHFPFGLCIKKCPLLKF